MIILYSGRVEFDMDRFHIPELIFKCNNKIYSIDYFPKGILPYYKNNGKMYTGENNLRDWDKRIKL